MADITRILGLKELSDALKALPEAIASKNGGPLRRALRKGAGLMLLDARNRAPVGVTGNLKRAIVLSLNKRPGERGRTEAFWLGVKRGKRYRQKGNRKNGERWVQQKGTAYYGRFLEFGTSTIGKRPFMGPAFEATKQQVVELFRQELSKEITRIAARLARASSRLRK